jgi:hypothetical protein
MPVEAGGFVAIAPIQRFEIDFRRLAEFVLPNQRNLVRLHAGIAETIDLLVVCRTDGRRRLVRTGTIGVVVVLRVDGHVDRALVAELESRVRTELPLQAVTGIVTTELRGHLAALAALFQDHVDDATDGVRAVTCGLAVTQHLDALDRRDREWR